MRDPSPIPDDITERLFNRLHPLTGRCLVKSLVAFLAASLFLLFPALARAQNTGRIECARGDGYIYLYSSMTTLDVRSTLQCGEIVQITGRFETYYAVRTAKDEVGYVPFASLVVLKDLPGTGLPKATSPSPERISYDARPDPPPPPVNPPFVLAKGTQVRLKVLKTLTSTTAHTSDAMEFAVIEDVLVDGVVVIPKGAKAAGVVDSVETKKRFGRGGSLAFHIASVRLADNELAPLHCFQEISGSSNTSAEAVLPLASGKDAAILEDAEFTAVVDTDVQLKREAFAAPTAPVRPEASLWCPIAERAPGRSRSAGCSCQRLATIPATLTPCRWLYAPFDLLKRSSPIEHKNL